MKQVMEAVTDVYFNPPKNAVDDNGRMYLNLLAEEFGLTTLKARRILIALKRKKR